jgi:radical SAM protein with 4Fe4S-binding SPASM domain
MIDNTDIFNRFPIIQAGNEIHLTPMGGTLFAEGSPSPMRQEEVDFLIRCDGTHPIREILPKNWSGSFADLTFLFFISQLVQQNRIRLSEVPNPTKIRVTGSKTAFLPPHMSIELTTACNLSCRHCYRKSAPQAVQTMPTGTLLALLQSLVDSGLRVVELTGGEPLLHPHFKEIFSFCTDHMLSTAVMTNGTILSYDIFELLVAKRDSIFLSISLDGSTAEKHNLRRGSETAFQRTVKHIALLSSAGIKVRVAMAVDEGNFDDIEATLLLARELGAAVFSYTPVLPLGRAKDWANVKWNVEYDKVVKMERELIEKYKDFLGFLSPELTCGMENGDNCGAGYRTYAMDPYGYVRPCPLYEDTKFLLGNLLSQSLEEVFSNPLAYAFENVVPPNQALCDGCERKNYCLYCTLRGLQSSDLVPECRWRHLPGTEALMKQERYSMPWEGSKVPSEGTHI